MATYEWLNRALDGTPVWDLGQLCADDRMVLNRAVRAGKLCKGRGRFCGIPRLKTIWYREDCVPQAIMAEEYWAQQKAEKAA